MTVTTNRQSEWWALQGRPLCVSDLAVLPLRNAFLGTEYLYVAEFASGWVKVGRTGDPRTRLQSHARSGTAVAPAGSMERCWVSRLTKPNSRAIEKRLINVGTEMCSGRYRREYFDGCSFAGLVEAGTRLADVEVVDEAVSA